VVVYLELKQKNGVQPIEEMLDVGFSAFLLVGHFFEECFDMLLE
jgi:hypothetical protein